MATKGEQMSKSKKTVKKEVELAPKFEALVWDIGLDELVDAFCLAMKTRLYEKFKVGYTGWDTYDVEDLILKMQTKAEPINPTETDLVDVANLAAMIWNRR